MRYVKLEEGRIEDAPQNYTTPDGKTICNFPLDATIMLEYGYKPFVAGEREPNVKYDVSYEETEEEVREILTVHVPTEWEIAEEEERKRQARIKELKEKINELKLMSIDEILAGNKQSSDIYNSIIDSLTAELESIEHI